MDDPALVCRRWTDQDGVVREEAFSDELAWTSTPTLTEIESGEWTGGIHLVSEEAWPGSARRASTWSTRTPSGWLPSHVRSRIEGSSAAGSRVPITREEAEPL